MVRIAVTLAMVFS